MGEEPSVRHHRCPPIIRYWQRVVRVRDFHERASGFRLSATVPEVICRSADQQVVFHRPGKSPANPRVSEDRGKPDAGHLDPLRPGNRRGAKRLCDDETLACRRGRRKGLLDCLGGECVGSCWAASPTSHRTASTCHPCSASTSAVQKSWATISRVSGAGKDNGHLYFVAFDCGCPRSRTGIHGQMLSAMELRAARSLNTGFGRTTAFDCVPPSPCGAGYVQSSVGPYQYRASLPIVQSARSGEIRRGRSPLGVVVVKA